MTDVHIAGRISHFFAVNRPLSILLLLAALVFGLVAFFLTPKQYNPEITRPAFAVTIAYPGSDTETAINRVVYELVEKIDTVPGVEDVYTEVHDGSVINTTVIFAVGYDKTKAKVDLLSQLNQHSYLARGNIQTPSVMEINPETIPVLQIVFGSNSLDVAELRARVQGLVHELSLVSDVSELSVYGGYVPTMVVEVDPVRLAQAGSTLDAVSAVLASSQSHSRLSGVRSGGYVLDVVFDGLATSPAELGDVYIGNGVKLRDVAKVYEGAGSDRSYVYFDAGAGRGEVVMVSVAKVEGASAPVVTKAFLATLDATLAKSEYADLSYQVVGNDGQTAEAEIYGLTQNLVTSIAIVAVVLLLFLSTRAALVVLIAIPVTLLVVFGLGLLFGQTINRITLFALILSLGLLVDSAIVAVENIYTHLRRWRHDPSVATKERVVAVAIDEIGVGLLLSTLTSVIVFLPMNYITGMMGPYMGPIAFFVPAALIVSFLVAIVVTPFIASHVLHVEDRQSKVSVWFGVLMQRITNCYTKFLKQVLESRTLQNKLLLGALGVFMISLILPLTGLVHFQMLPRADRDQFYVYLDLPVGTDIEVTNHVANELATVLLGDDEVQHVQEFVGTAPVLDFNGMFKGANGRIEPWQATLRVNVSPAGKRSLSSTDITSRLRRQVREQLGDVSSAVRFIEEPPGPPVRATLVAKVSAGDNDTQVQAAADIKRFIAGVSGVVDTYVSDEAAVGRVRYQFDYAAAASLGVSPEAAMRTLGVLNGGYGVTELIGGAQREYTPIELRLLAEVTATPNFIDVLSVVSDAGDIVSLRSVLTVGEELRPSSVQFEDAKRLSYVTAEVEGKSIIYVTIDVLKQLLAGTMSGYQVIDWNLWSLTLEDEGGQIIDLVWGGEWEMTLENFRDLGIAMGVALLMVYALLVAQYNRFDTPGYVLVTVPLGLVGILWGFLVLDGGFGIYLTATALIGFIALIGIVVNNAIIFLEYVDQSVAAGAMYKEALIAAGEARLRPIFLTSLTTVLGSLTIASDPVWSGLAWSIVFGLSFSTVLTLVVYPTLLIRFARHED